MSAAVCNITSSPRYDIYFIHDNGGIPFRVAIDEINKRAIVYLYNNEQTYENYDIDYSVENEPVILDTLYEKVFLGDPLSEQFIKDGNKFDLGNSILLHIAESQYIFIGMYIYEFESPEPITKYFSPVGNNDVPYPFAKTDNYTLLMIEDIIIPNNNLDEHGAYRPIFAHHPYMLYYMIGDGPFTFERYKLHKQKINGRMIHERLYT